MVLSTGYCLNETSCTQDASCYCHLRQEENCKLPFLPCCLRQAQRPTSAAPASHAKDTVWWWPHAPAPAPPGPGLPPAAPSLAPAAPSLAPAAMSPRPPSAPGHDAAAAPQPRAAAGTWSATAACAPVERVGGGWVTGDRGGAACRLRGVQVKRVGVWVSELKVACPVQLL